MFRLSASFSKFVLQESLFRRDCLRATFPKGEGLSHRQTTICIFPVSFVWTFLPDSCIIFWITI